jgi:hypothetical protein
MTIRLHTTRSASDAPTAPSLAWRAAFTGALLLVALLTGAADAQVTTKPGVLDVEVTRAAVGGRYSRADAEAVDALLDRVLAIVRSNPAVASPPADVCPKLTASAAKPEFSAYGGGAVNFFFPLLLGGRCRNVTVSGVVVHVNSASPLLARNELRGPRGAMEDAGGAMYLLPRRSDSPADFPRYGDFLVIAKPDVPLFLPLSKERYLRTLERHWEETAREQEAEIASLTASGAGEGGWTEEERARAIAENRTMLKELEPYASPEQLAEMRRSMEVVVEQMDRSWSERPAHVAEMAAAIGGGAAEARASLEAVRRELASLSAEQRKQPTCLVLDEVYTTAGPADCDPALQPVVLNPGYFERALSPTRAQLILVRTAEKSHSGENREHRELRARVFQTLDYAALAALVRR